MSALLLIVPTFREAENIPALLEAIFSLPTDVDLLIVDDASGDGTKELLERHRQWQQHLYLIERKKKAGLGTAYLDGFRWGLERDYRVFFQMDADLSHHPKDILRLLEAVGAGADVAVGSRYCEQGGLENWPWYRRMVSRVAGIYVRALIGLKMTDPTSGFKALRRQVIAAIDPAIVHSDGYAFQIELHYFVQQRGFQLVEIPITFTERRAGQSKLSVAIIGQAIQRVLALRKNKQLSQRSSS